MIVTRRKSSFLSWRGQEQTTTSFTLHLFELSVLSKTAMSDMKRGHWRHCRKVPDSSAFFFKEESLLVSFVPPVQANRRQNDTCAAEHLTCCGSHFRAEAATAESSGQLTDGQGSVAVHEDLQEVQHGLVAWFFCRHLSKNRHTSTLRFVLHFGSDIHCHNNTRTTL